MQKTTVIAKPPMPPADKAVADSSIGFGRRGSGGKFHAETTKKIARKSAQNREKDKGKKSARKMRADGGVVKTANVRKQGSALLEKNPIVAEAISQFPGIQNAVLSKSGRILVPPESSSWVPLASLRTHPPLPAQLYKYAPPNLSHIESVIVGEQILFTNPLRFNDPFDCRRSRAEWEDPKSVIRHWRTRIEAYKKAGFRSSLDLNTGEEREQHEEKMEHDPEYRNNWLREVHEIFLSHFNMGVFCLTLNERSIQMWAHYAGNHTGVCYKFDMSGYESLALPESECGTFPFFAVLPVSYSEEFPARENTKLSPEGFPKEFAEKHMGWSYEEEWRALMPDCKTDLGGQRLPPNWSACQGAGFYHHRGTLNGVILGCRAEATMKKKVIDMANLRKLGVWEARPKIAEYDLEILPRNQHAEEEDKRIGN